MTGTIISRADARAQGLTRYFTGKACKRQHICERYVSNLECVQCVYDKTKARAWHKENPDRHREHNRRWDAANREKKREYHSKNRERLNAKSRARYQSLSIEERRAERRAWYDKNRETAIERSRQWLRDNPERAKAKKQNYYKANKDTIDAKNKAWAEANPERVKANMAVRKHRRRVRENDAGGTFTASEVRAILAAQNHRCAYCRADLRKVKKHLDHIMPLALGGSNERSNLQWTCHACNLSKGKKSPIEFAQQMGRLL